MAFKRCLKGDVIKVFIFYCVSGELFITGQRYFRAHMVRTKCAYRAHHVRTTHTDNTHQTKVCRDIAKLLQRYCNAIAVCLS